MTMESNSLCVQAVQWILARLEAWELGVVMDIDVLGQ